MAVQAEITSRPGSSVVERFLGKEEVGSSILLPGSIDRFTVKTVSQKSRHGRYYTSRVHGMFAD